MSKVSKNINEGEHIVRKLFRRLLPEIKVTKKRETADLRAKRKQQEFAYAKWRTAFSFGGFIFQVLGFIAILANLALIIWITFLR